MVRGLFVAALLAVGLAACGDAEDATGTTPTGGPCTSVPVAAPALQLDLDGDRSPDDVHQVDAEGTCPKGLLAVVGEHADRAPVEDALPVTALAAITLPGHTGEVVLATQTHPRGGAQQRLFGYADDDFAEMTPDGEPILEFVATDAPTEHVSAACTADGFEVTEAVAHQPIGIVPAWDVYRTSYTVDGNTVTAGPRTEIEDNVLDDELAEQYPEVVAGSMFENCRARVN